MHVIFFQSPYHKKEVYFAFLKCPGPTFRQSKATVSDGHDWQATFTAAPGSPPELPTCSLHLEGKAVCVGLLVLSLQTSLLLLSVVRDAEVRLANLASYV